MKPLYLFELVLLSALWGASFLFMRVAVPDFGPLALIEMRTLIAAITLLPVVFAYKQLQHIINNFKLLLIVGLFSTAIPFCLLSYAVLTVSAGYASILNATAPMFTAIIAWYWMKEGLDKIGMIGLLIGFLGVGVLVFDNQEGSTEIPLIPVIAALIATFCYGIGINYTKNKLSHMNPIAIAFGSQFSAALCMAPLAMYFWPEHMPSAESWQAVSVLGMASTGLAFILFFRLVANIGSQKTITVTYLIPFFGVIWGIIFLDESFTIYMAIGAALILSGVALSTGVVPSFMKKK